MYYVRLLVVMSFICASSLVPLLAYAGLNEMFDPNVCWTKVYYQYNQYIVLGSILLGVGITLKYDDKFIKFIGK